MFVPKQIKVKGIEDLNKQIDKLAKDIRISKRRALKAIGEGIRAKSQENIIGAKLVDKGDLLGSSYVSTGMQGLFRTIVEVGYKEEYAVYQHEGWNGQALPPFQPILEWVERKVGLVDEEAESFAMLVSYKLANKGHKAEPFLEQALDEELSYITRKMQQHMKADLIRTLKKR